MTREEAKTNLDMIRVAFGVPVTKEQKELVDETFDMAIKALENIGHLTDRPCDVCEFHTDGCSQWTCVFSNGLFGGMA